MATQSDRLSPWIPTAFAVLAVLLGVGIGYRHYTAKSDKTSAVATIKQYSNQWVTASAKLQEQKKVNLRLERDLENQAQDLSSVSNQLASASAHAEETVTAIKEVAQKNNSQLGWQNNRIAELEGEQKGLASTMDELNQSMSKLEANVAEVERKLKASQGDRELLVQELKRLQSEKADLERRMYDLAAVRAQIHKLRTELSLSRRLDWIRHELAGGFFGRDPLSKALASTTSDQKSFSLDVEMPRNGAAKVVSSTPPTAPH